MAKSAELDKETKTGHEHDRIEVRSVCADCGKELDKKTFDRRELSNQDVDKESAAALPERPWSSSMTSTAVGGQPRASARWRSRYWRSVLSWWWRTCSWVDGRT